jgi:hypothetical protein
MMLTGIARYTQHYGIAAYGESRHTIVISNAH